MTADLEAYLRKAEKFLFVCSGNTCRSPMAAALARYYLPWAQVVSAGTATVTGLSASIGAMDAMQALGLSLDDHQSRPLNIYLLEEADLILTMTAGHKKQVLAYYPEGAEKTFTLGELCGEGEDIEDPFGLPVEQYIECARQMEAMIRRLAEKCGDLPAGKSE